MRVLRRARLSLRWQPLMDCVASRTRVPQRHRCRRRRRGPRRARRRRRAGRRRAPGRPARRGAGGDAGRAGLLVVRRAVPRRLPRAAPPRGQGLRRARVRRLVRLGPVRAGADRGDGPDRLGYAWAEGFVEFAAGDLRSWLHAKGVRWFPLVQWAERGGYLAGGHGNSVPRFHVTWGTGPGILEPFVARRCSTPGAGRAARRAVPAPRHRPGHHRRRASPASGATSSPTDAGRREPSQLARVVGQVELSAQRRRHRDRRHRREPRPGPRRTWPPVRGPAARADALRRARPRRRAPASASRRRRAPPWSTRTGCGTTPRASPTTRRSGRGTASGSWPGRASLWLDADGDRLPAPAVPRLRLPRRAAAHHRARRRPLLVRARQDDHREGVRAVRLGAEPGPDRQGHAAAAGARQAAARSGRSRRSRRSPTSSSGPTRRPSSPRR